MVIEDNENQLGHPRRGKVSMEIPLILEERVQCEGEAGESSDRWGTWGDDVGTSLDTSGLTWGPLDWLDI